MRPSLLRPSLFYGLLRHSVPSPCHSERSEEPPLLREQGRVPGGWEAEREEQSRSFASLRMTELLPGMPEWLPRMPEWLLRMPGWLLRMPGWLLRMPGWLLRMPELLPGMTEWLPRMPERLPRMPESLPGMREPFCLPPSYRCLPVAPLTLEDPEFAVDSRRVTLLPSSGVTACFGNSLTFSFLAFVGVLSTAGHVFLLKRECHAFGVQPRVRFDEVIQDAVDESSGLFVGEAFG